MRLHHIDTYHILTSACCVRLLLRKVEALQELTSALRMLDAAAREGGAAAPDPTSDVEKLSPKFVELLEDPHYKVGVARPTPYEVHADL